MEWHLTDCIEHSPYEKPAIIQLIEKFPAFFFEPEVTLPHSQASATCPYPEPDQSSPSLPLRLLENPF